MDPAQATQPDLTAPRAPATRVDEDVLARLTRLRRLLRVRLAGEGLAWVVVAAVAAALALFVVDYALRLDRPLRAVTLTLAVAALVAVVFRRLVRPLSVPLTPLDLALLIERRHPALADRLATALQWSSRPPGGASPALLARVAQQASRMARRINFRGVVDFRRLAPVGALAVGALALLAALGLWRGDLLEIALKRNVLLADVPWPQATYLRVVGGPDFQVVRGEDLTVVVEVAPRSRRTPDAVVVHATYPSVGLTRDRVERDPAHPRRFVKTFRTVAEPFEFRVTGGDDRTAPPHRVSLIDPPALREVLFTVRPPAYAGRPPSRFDGSAGVIPAPLGAVVEIVGEANKDLTAAELLLDAEPAGVLTVQDMPTRDGRAPRRVVGRFRVEGDNRPQTHTLAFALEDRAGHRSPRGAGLLLRVLPDRPPEVRVETADVGRTVTPQATVPLRTRAEDDCGVAAVRIEFEPEPTRAATQPARTHSEDVPLPPEPAREMRIAHELDLRPGGLQPGSTVRIRPVATDSMPARLGGPNEAIGNTIRLRVVSPDELADALLRRQQEIRLEFLQAVGLQETARAKAADAAGQFQAGKTDAARALAESAASVQGSVRGEVFKAADGLADILAQIAANRLDAADTQERLAAVQGLLAPLPDRMEDVADRLTDAASAESAAAAGIAARAAAEQARLRGQMERALTVMERELKRQDIINRLKLIARMWDELTEETRRLHEEQIQEAIEGVLQPPSGGADEPEGTRRP